MSNFNFLLRDARAAFRRKDCDGARRVVGDMQRGRLTTVQERTVVRLLNAVEKCEIRGLSGRRRRGIGASRRRAPSDRLREQERPTVMGYELDREALTPVHRAIVRAPGDYGRDPLGDGTFRMVPSGDIVDYAESERRLEKYRRR